MTLLFLLARGAAASASAAKAACIFTGRTSACRLAPRLAATRPVQPHLLSAPFSSCMPLLVTRKPAKKVSAATAPKTKKALAKARATVAPTKTKTTKKTATKTGAARKSLKTKSRIADRKLKIRRPTAVQRAKAQAKLANARASAKSKALKAREAAKKEKIKAEVRAVSELARAFPKRLTAVSVFFADSLSGGVGSRTTALKIAWGKWKSMSEAAKEVYMKKGAANIARYQSDVKQWYSSLSPPQKLIVNSRTFQKKLRRYQARAVRSMRPKPPLKPYAQFYKKNFGELSAKVKRDQPGLKGKDITIATCKLVAARWNMMSSEEKKTSAA